MEKNKDNYTSKEIEDMISAVRDYDFYKESYTKIHINTSTWGSDNKNRIEFRKINLEKFNNALENCKEKIPKSLLNKLNIQKIEINPENGHLEFKDIE
jgi:hypothetical protein